MAKKLRSRQRKEILEKAKWRASMGLTMPPEWRTLLPEVQDEEAKEKEAVNLEKVFSWETEVVKSQEQEAETSSKSDKMAGIKFFVVDTFAQLAFKGFPVAVLFLDEDNKKDDWWLHCLISDFNFSEICILTPITGSDNHFRLRSFTPAVEVNFCGHALLASAHVVFSNTDSDSFDFHTKSGIVSSKRVKDCVENSIFLIELTLPVIPTCEFNSVDDDLSLLSESLNGAKIIDVKATRTDTIVELSSWESVTELKDAKFPFEMIVTAAARARSQFDFCYYWPQEEPVTGTAYCVLAQYWSSKLNKSHFKAYQVSSRAYRGGIQKIYFDKERVVLGGKAVTVLEGHVLV